MPHFLLSNFSFPCSSPEHHHQLPYWMGGWRRVHKGGLLCGQCCPCSNHSLACGEQWQKHQFSDRDRSPGWWLGNNPQFCALLVFFAFWSESDLLGGASEPEGTRKKNNTHSCAQYVISFFEIFLSVSHTQTHTAAHPLAVTPCFLFQKPICWVCLWRDSRTRPSGWQCVTAEGRLLGWTSPGFFPKMPKAKHCCSQSMKAKSWKPDWLIGFTWPFMKGRTWPVCIILNMEPQRGGLLISPNTVSLADTILIWTPPHFSYSKCRVSHEWDPNIQSLSSRFNWLFYRHLLCESRKPHDSSAKPLRWWTHHT